MASQYEIKASCGWLYTSIVDKETGVLRFMQGDDSVQFNRSIETAEENGVDTDMICSDYFTDISDKDYLDGLFRIIGLVPNDIDGAEAIYWFLADHHNGQSSLEYRMLSLLSEQFSPPRLSHGIDSCDELSQDYYHELCDHFRS
jgi:hypothetical protein